MRPRRRNRGSGATCAAGRQAHRGDAALARLGAEVHLQANVQRRGVEGPLRREPLGDARPIDRVHPGKVLGDRPRLIGLDAADEVPGELQR